MTFNFDAAPDSHPSAPQVPAARAEAPVASEEPKPRRRALLVWQPTVLALEREIASDVLVVSSSG